MPPVADALQWQMPSSGRCPPVADALQWQMPSSGRCPPVADALQWHLTHLEPYPLANRFHPPCLKLRNLIGTLMRGWDVLPRTNLSFSLGMTDLISQLSYLVRGDSANFEVVRPVSRCDQYKEETNITKTVSGCI